MTQLRHSRDSLLHDSHAALLAMPTLNASMQLYRYSSLASLSLSLSLSDTSESLSAWHAVMTPKKSGMTKRQHCQSQSNTILCTGRMNLLVWTCRSPTRTLSSYNSSGQLFLGRAISEPQPQPASRELHSPHGMSALQDSPLLTSPESMQFHTGSGKHPTSPT